MTQPAQRLPIYDVYADLSATHVEIGYLLLLLLLLAAFDLALACAWAAWPGEDVYLVPGITVCRSVPEHWGAALPERCAVLPAAASTDRPDAPQVVPLILPAAGSALPTTATTATADPGASR